MFAKLKHVAIVSDRFTLLGKFYESLFGMRSSASVVERAARSRGRRRRIRWAEYQFQGSRPAVWSGPLWVRGRGC